MNEWYKKSRLALIEKLGGRCSNPECDEDDPDKLEFDHIRGRTWVANQHNRWVRLAKVKAEAAQGLIQLLCSECNKRKYHEGGF